VHLPPNACRALQSLGVLGEVMRLPGVAFQPQHISLLTYSSGTILKRMNLAPDMERTYGFPYLSVNRASLHQCLRRCADTLEARIRFNCIVESIDFDLTAVKLAGDQVIEADLIIGADGENSVCRSMLLGKPDPPLHFGHQIFSCEIPFENIDDKSPDLGHFLSDPGVSWWMGPGTMAIASTTRGEREYINVMGGIIEHESTKIRGRPVGLAKEVVQAKFSDWDPTINKLIELSTGCHIWTSTKTNVLEQWNHPSCCFTLLGDAAHAMTPYL
jgi:salicylate hydroxylase